MELLSCLSISFFFSFLVSLNHGTARWKSPVRPTCLPAKAGLNPTSTVFCFIQSIFKKSLVTRLLESQEREMEKTY